VTSPSKKRPPHGTILYNKVIRMIFKKSGIVRSKLMNRDKILVCFGHIKDIFSIRFRWGVLTIE
jgi:hypothetical protein